MLYCLITWNFRDALICEFINHEKWETWKWKTFQTVYLNHFENVVGDELSYYKSVVIIIIIIIIITSSLVVVAAAAAVVVVVSLL